MARTRDTQYTRRNEEREFPRGEAGIRSCKICGAFSYKKSWRHVLPKGAAKGKIAKTEMCPACTMIARKQFEGEVIIDNVPSKIKTDLLNLVNAFTKKAHARDPLHRLIAIQHPSLARIRLTTTENQLALQLAKQIAQVFKKIATKISYSPTPSDVVYIRLVFRD